MSDCSIHRSCLRGCERGPGLHVEFSLKIALYTALRSKRSLLDRLTLYTPRSFSVERSRSPLFRISTHSAFLFPAPLTPRAILLRIASGRKPSFSDAVVGCCMAASPLSPPSSTHPPEQPPLLLAHHLHSLPLLLVSSHKPRLVSSATAPRPLLLVSTSAA